MTSDKLARYRVVETIRGDDGLVATITERIDAGYLSYKIQKEFVQGGEVKLTAFLGPHHLPANKDLLQKVDDRLKVLTDRARVGRVRKSS